MCLRKNNSEFKASQRRLNRRMKNKRYLRNEIYSNHNIFQSNVNLYGTMTAQNILWDKKYNYQCSINQLRDENSGLRARIWNM